MLLQCNLYSYKEDSEEDDLMGSDIPDYYDNGDAQIPIDDNRPVIEKIIECRQGPVDCKCVCVRTTIGCVCVCVCEPQVNRL